MRSTVKSAKRNQNQEFRNRPESCLTNFGPNTLAKVNESLEYLKKIQAESDVEIDNCKEEKINNNIFSGQIGQNQPLRQITEYQNSPNYSFVSSIQQCMAQYPQLPNQQIHSQQKLADELNQNKIPFYFNDQYFMQIINNRLSFMREFDKKMQNINGFIQHCLKIQKYQMQNNNQDQINRQTNHHFQPLQMLIQDLHLNNAQKIQAVQTIATKNIYKSNTQNLIMQTYDQLIQHLQAIETLQKQTSQQKQALKQKIQKRQKIIRPNQFDISIIKLQFHDIFYRCGVQILADSIAKHESFNPENTKWEVKSQKIKEMDLKIFVLTMLYPMVRYLFNNFSFQSNIYKVMFGMDQFLEKKQVESSLFIIRRRIEKHFNDNRFSSLSQCIDSTVKTQKKKIIFVGEEKRLNEKMNQLIHSLKNFSNSLMTILGLNFSMTQDYFQNTLFRCGYLEIEYIYEGVSVKTTINVLFCSFEYLNSQFVKIVRQKTGKQEPVLFWLEIPKIMKKSKYSEIMNIYLMLSKCQKFSIASNGKIKEKKTKNG